MARIVAELGRPETPDETAARKAASSARYRSSQTFRNLIAGMLAILAVLAVIIFGVPRGNPAPAPEIDVAAEAAALSDTLDRPVLGPVLPDWRVNAASVQGDKVEAWTVVYVPGDDPGFLRLAQGFDADDAWVAEILSGNAPTGTVTIDGITWDEYEISDPQRSANITYALGTTAGADRVLVYGSTQPGTTQQVAAAVGDDIRTLREAAE